MPRQRQRSSSRPTSRTARYPTLPSARWIRFRHSYRRTGAGRAAADKGSDTGPRSSEPGSSTQAGWAEPKDSTTALTVATSQSSRRRCPQRFLYRCSHLPRPRLRDPPSRPLRLRSRRPRDGRVGPEDGELSRGKALTDRSARVPTPSLGAVDLGRALR